MPRYLTPLLALQLTDTSVWGGSSKHLTNYDVAWLSLAFSGMQSVFCSPIRKSFWRRDKSQSCVDKKSDLIIKLELSLPALTMTVSLYVHVPKPTSTSTSVLAKVGTDLPETPLSQDISYILRRRGNLWIFLYRRQPMIITEALELNSAKVLRPSTATGINQQPGWLMDSSLMSLNTPESDVKVHVQHLELPDWSLDLDWECTLTGVECATWLSLGRLRLFVLLLRRPCDSLSFWLVWPFTAQLGRTSTSSFMVWVAPRTLWAKVV